MRKTQQDKPATPKTKCQSEICLRKVLEEKDCFPNKKIQISLILLCCNVCKKIEAKEELDKYEKLLVFPIFVSQRRIDNSLMKILGIRLLEKLAEDFGNAEDKQVEKFLTNLQKVAQGKIKYSHKWLNNISEGTYCKIIARLYWMQNYHLLYMISIQYIFNTTIINGSDVRTNWYHINNTEKPFFQIGIALDEGIVQTFAIELFDSIKHKELAEEGEKEKSASFLSDAYFFEMKFVDKLIDTFKIDRKNSLCDLSFPNSCMDILAKETKEIDPCDLYNLLSLSDQQKWKEVNSILKKYRR